MNDTPNHVREIYAGFIMSKSDAERFRMGFEMADMGKEMVEQQFRNQHPDWSDGAIKAASFERIYRNDFSAEELSRIKTSLLAFYQEHASMSNTEK